MEKIKEGWGEVRTDSHQQNSESPIAQQVENTSPVPMEKENIGVKEQESVVGTVSFMQKEEEILLGTLKREDKSAKGELVVYQYSSKMKGLGGGEGTRLQLKELDLNVMQEKEKERRDVRKTTAGTWKRVGIDRRKDRGLKTVQYANNTKSGRAKRERSGMEGVEVLQLEEEGGHTVKHPRVEYPIISSMVELASHEWPQVDI